ncbi:MAG: hypothetical protein HN995_02020 [Candidatus Marinimicrobia bacterium]|jgi:endonuclease/exonuclease/phosphatase family metal-dependent hydrolase|nr:hypothetical protein [Candidatus Neomarinimicrobiota bacterium]MBT3576513.1 hypothetical protein [Candidatus Neomarinimicrobiota bacterium]MBT3681299.1 hypothetical protein [Candidatus Neomarinimicrobiota bacterium]MBT3951513.1 hypothetical protein [Candidatus Neomarinimicrobiota bacterium]MBT4253905.1 hypothetical protein [Candidatus Neomarinimicrobiota bacterium]
MLREIRQILAIILMVWTLGLLVACAEPVDSDLPIGPQIPSIDSDANISIVTWNIENFPQMGNRTTERVELILDSLNADIYCLQEIDNKSDLDEIVDALDQYQVVHSSSDSYVRSIVFKPSVLLFLGTTEILRSNSYEFAWRPPFLSSFLFSQNGKEQTLNIIDVHLKAFGDQESIQRRHDACNLLHDYLSDAISLGDSNFVVAGDWNDDIHDTDNSGQYSFEAFLNDNTNFRFTTDSLSATGSVRDASYPSYPSFIDHILISRSLFDEERNSSISTIRLDEVFGDYSSVVSDHRPVAWSFKPQ